MVVKGDIPINIIWTLNGNVINTPGVSIMKMGPKISALSIESVSAIHRGTYTCLAENAAGHSNHSAELFVNGILIIFYYCVEHCIFIY